MWRLLVAVALLTLTACDVQDGAGAPSREVANEIATEILTRRLPPGSPVAPIAGCVVENATNEELFRLVAAQLTGITAATTQTVVDILQRKETISCAVSKGWGFPAIL